VTLIVGVNLGEYVLLAADARVVYYPPEQPMRYRDDTEKIQLTRLGIITLEATIDETLLRAPGRFAVVVKNVGPADPANPRLGDGTSNRAWLVVGYR
jgi:hypothetical protein